MVHRFKKQVVNSSSTKPNGLAAQTGEFATDGRPSALHHPNNNRRRVAYN
jgi:hypothetical protein